METIQLYEFFIHEAKLTAGLSVDRQTHHTIMNHLNVALNIIYEARLKLEAIGLLQTYKQEDRQGKLYTYELLPPFSPDQFFNDMMLAELLERHVGSRRFAQLKQFYLPTIDKQQGENVTASFQDVFQTYEPKLGASFTKQSVEKAEPKTAIKLEPVDFSLINDALKQRNIPVTRVLTEANERIITQLVNLYHLESYEVEKALLWALTDENELDIEQFKAACHDFFSSKTNVANVKLTLKTEEATQAKTVETRPPSKIDELVERLETISPKELLEDLSGGNHASSQDLKMISDIMVKQGLTAPVMNVLIHFTMLKTNMMLSRPYMEKIASHWSRAQLKTAKEAMDFALEQSAPQKQQRRQQSYRSRSTKSDEVIPDWFKDRKVDKEKGTTENEATLSEDEQKAQAEMEAILKKYSRN